MPIIVEDNRSKLKKRQSYRSQKPDREEEIREKARNEMARQGATGEEIDKLTLRDKAYLKQATDPAFDKIRKRMLAEENPSFKYGGMKKKTKKMKTGGMSKARGTGCAIRGTNFKGIF
jgi:hypothetical protein